MDVSLAERLSDARRRVADEVPGLARAAFDNDPHEMALWLDAAAQAADARDYVIPSADDAPTLLYLWMNDFPFNPDRWFLAASAYGPAVPPENSYDWHRTVVGEEIGDLRVPLFTLTGMGDVQAWFASDGLEQPAADAVEELVLLSAFDLIGQGLHHAQSVRLQVAVSRGDEPRTCVWDGPDASPTIETWIPASTQDDPRKHEAGADEGSSRAAD